MIVGDLFPPWLRLWHWANAGLFLTAVVTGASMHFAGHPGLIRFTSAVTLHNASGILLTIGWVVFVIGNLVSDNGRHYRVRFRGLVDDLLLQARYYTWDIFRGAPHPFPVTSRMKFNTLQQLSYLGAMYLLMPLLSLSGWAFLFPKVLPKTLFGLGSLWLVALTHSVVAYLLVLFVIVHIYIITIGDNPWANMWAMITGRHSPTDPGAEPPAKTSGREA